MSIALPDSFDGELQLFNYAPLAGTTDTVLDTTLVNRHVDVRIALQDAIFRNRLMSDFDNDPMNDPLLDGDSMQTLESVVKVPAENWAKTGTGVTSFDVAARAAYKGWRSIKVICSGAQLDGVFESTPSDPAEAALGAIDISTMDCIGIVLDQSALTHPIVTVVLYLTSDVNGFGGTADSDPLVLNNSTASRWATAVSGITGGVDFHPTAVTGVKLEFVDDGVNFPLVTEAFHVFSLRAYKTTYDPKVDLDLNTRRGALGVPVTWDLVAPSHTVVAFMRGTGATSDPVGQDATQRMILRLGTLFASGGTNKVGFRFREDTGGYVFAEFRWNGATASWRVGTLADGILDTQTVSAWATCVANELVVIEAKLVGNKMTTRVYLSNNNEQISTREYTNDFTDPMALAPSAGRVGWYASVLDRDAYLLDYDPFFTSLASGVTKVRQYLSPIESVKLDAAFAADSQNFTQFTGIGADVTMDASKFVAPATFSWATKGPVVSNAVRIKTFNESYLDFDIWVPLEATQFPAVTLGSDGLSGIVEVAPLVLQPNQWNHIHIELADAFRDGGLAVVDDLTYYVIFDGPMPYTYYVSNMGIFTRNVAWAARVNSLFDFREFRDMVNAVDGLLHFPREERGTELQIAFSALTENAWASVFASEVKYAPLGLPLYYRPDGS